MNLLENGYDENETNESELNREVSPINQKTPKNRKQPVQSDMKTLIIAFLIVVILILLLVIFCFWRINSKTKTQGIDSLQEDILQGIDDQNKEEVETIAETVEQTADKEIEDSAEDDINYVIVSDEPVETKNESIAPTNEDDPLNKDMYYEDYSYSKEFILQEMIKFWESGNLDAIYDLTALRRYRKLSYSLSGTNDFYYIGEKDGNEVPNGIGLAVYGEDAYYYGHFQNGKRDGEGAWYHFYYDSKPELTKNGIYTLHSYSGSWKNDLPDGNGAEHYDVDNSKIVEEEYIISNVVGGFKNGRYDGEMFATTTNSQYTPGEWKGFAENGVFKLQRDLTVIGESPVWVNSDNPDVYMKLPKGANKDCGITELIQKVEKH